MSRKQLTSKQHQFLEFLNAHIQEHKVWPTYREIVDSFGYRSPNSVTQNLQALAKKGYLRRDHSGYHLVDPRPGGGDALGIPVRLRLSTAGMQDTNGEPEVITLRTLFPDIDRLFAVRLAGRGLPAVGLADGDVLLVSRDSVSEGDVGVVAREGGLTLCRVFREADGYRFEPVYEGDAPVSAPASVLGRYAGHVTAHGIFRRGISDFPPAPLSSVPGLQIPAA